MRSSQLENQAVEPEDHINDSAQHARVRELDDSDDGHANAAHRGRGRQNMAGDTAVLHPT
jgi:hypothetical protein